MDIPAELSTALDRDIAQLKAKAADYDARHHVVEAFGWPQGVRIAVNFTADFDAMLLRRVLNEPPLQLAKGEFGGRVGIWRLIELFDSHSVKATIFTPGRICELYPQAIKAASRSGHEIADHMWEHQVPKDPVLERDHLRKACAAIEKLTGRRPIGTRSWHTRRLLIEEGYIYNSHDTPDHRPHYLSEPDGSLPLLNLPFHYAIDDAMFFSFAWLNTENDAQRMMDPPEHLHASFRVRPRLADRHARPADRTHEGVARRVVPDLRGSGAPRSRRQPGALTGRLPCHGKTATRSATRRPWRTPR
jgi:peptidoglycan/xylan/chitin deacetylase (PgdA/CDA1 family)